MEPIRGVFPEQEFIDGVRQIANKIGAVLIVDEISAGFRMNTGGAHLKLGIKPDIAVFSKALGNGYPIGAIIGKNNIMDAAQRTFISSTCWTERIGPTAALATIRIHKRENVSKHLMKIGSMVQDGWKKNANKNNIKIEVGGIFPLSHFSFLYPNANSIKALFIQLMLERGFLASSSFYAMFAHNEKHIKNYLDATNVAFKFISKALSENNVDNLLIGKPSTSGFQRLA